MILRRFPGVVASLVTCTLFACSFGHNDDDEHDDNNFRADVIECEDALDRLHDCCPDFDVTVVQCDFSYDHTSGCGSTNTDSIKPAFTLEESTCIRSTSCEDLRANKVCDRGQAARAYASSTSTNDDNANGVITTYDASTHAPVCP